MLVQWWSWYFCLQKPRCQLWFLEPFEQGVLLPLCLLHREETSTLLWQIHLKSPALFLKLQASFFYSTGFARYSLGVNVFSTKVLIGDTIFTFPTRDRTAILRGHPSYAREGLASCSARGVPSFLSYFKILSIGPAPGVESTTSHSAVRRSTDWTNPAAGRF